MDSLHSHTSEIIGVAVAVVAVAAGVAYHYISKKPKACLDPEEFREFKLVDRKQLSHNVAKFKFALPTPDSVLGLPIGQHISCRGKDSLGDEVIKPYTPTTLDSDIGYFELVIKMYPQGRMSHHSLSQAAIHYNNTSIPMYIRWFIVKGIFKCGFSVNHITPACVQNTLYIDLQLQMRREGNNEPLEHLHQYHLRFPSVTTGVQEKKWIFCINSFNITLG